MPWLQEMRWPEVREYLAKKDIILIPVGSTEQHARHAPLGTDTMIAIRLAEDACQRTGVISAPPLWFGWSPHHMVLPGTISIRATVLQDLLFDAIQSLAHHGFAHFVVVNGHRITNIPWIQLAAQRAQDELKVQVAIYDPGYMEKEIADELGFGPLGHAEELETSQLLYLFPEMVDLTQAVDSPSHARTLYQVDPRYPGDTLCYVPSTLEQMQAIAEQTGGSTGQPSKSDASSGARLHQHLVDRLVQVIAALE
ncbi:MAG TPA: creatininase family protein [Anaerolineales bacterium]|nr:creatininase family protein [Anaerolineales bacterium]